MVKRILTLCLAAVSLSVMAQDYTTYLTPERGFTEVTSISGVVATSDNYYILCSAENNSLFVGVGPYEAKPNWASENTKALRYYSADRDPVFDLANFFTIEKSGNYIGLRNVVYSADLFQTHDNMGYVYVNTFTDPVLDEWSYLIPTYQNNYWMFESGKYPLSSSDWASGFLGPWNKTVMAGEAMALNRKNTADDQAGHYRLFRISKDKLMAERAKLWQSASKTHPVDFTYMVTNPSFETGNYTGWTLTCNEEQGKEEIGAKTYGMTNKDGQYLMNAWQWWAKTLSISQTVTGLLKGNYELSAVVCTWENRNVYFKGNDQVVNTPGVNDQTGIPVTMDVTIGEGQSLAIEAGSTGVWWDGGTETRTFFKLDNVQLKCIGVPLSAYAVPLPNDNTTLLEPDLWYYYDAPLSSDYQLYGNLDGVFYTADGNMMIPEITPSTATRQMTLNGSRHYFKTTRSDATLSIVPARVEEEKGTFTAVALNVDGLPNTVAGFNLNADGPGSTGTKLISQYLSRKGYDIIGCSEDFNYHGSLMESLTGYSAGEERKTLSAGGFLSGGLPFDTDGLNLVWKNSTLSASNETWTKWATTTNTDGNQYVKKGFRHYDATFNGVVFDVYVFHMDAGDASDSRHSQWRQLVADINSKDLNRPKLLIADTNSRWTREDLKTNFMDLLDSKLKASDVWVELCRDGVYPTPDMDDLTYNGAPTVFGSYEVVDKIIYINSVEPYTPQLVPTNFYIEQDYTYGTVQGTSDTKSLGDHKPLVATFKMLQPGEELPMEIALPNLGEDNQTIVDNANGAKANVTLSDRTLYKDGSWNTICLPFDMTAEQVTEQLAPSALKSLSTTAYEQATNTLSLNFVDATTIEAGKPYVVKWAQAEDWVNPVFKNVTINNTLSPVETNEVIFAGNYSPVSLNAGDNTVLFLGANNTLYYPSVDMNINACRAYFTLKSPLHVIDAADVSAVNTFVLGFDGNEPSSVISLKSQDDNDAAWYTISGVKLTGKPHVKGIYIHQGRKTVVK